MFDVQKVKITREGGIVDFGYLVEVANTVLFNRFFNNFEENFGISHNSTLRGDSIKVFTNGVIYLPNISDAADQWNSCLEKLIKKDVVFNPWNDLQEKDFCHPDGQLDYCALIHNKSNLSIIFDEDNETLTIKDNALEILYEAASVYLEHSDKGLIWDENLLKKIFSTKKGKDSNEYIKETKNIDELIHYAGSCWGLYGGIEFMKLNKLIKEKI
jgi:hypothetical protein